MPLALALACMLVGCEGATPNDAPDAAGDGPSRGDVGDGGTLDPGPPPKVHRPTAPPCVQPRPPGSPTSNAGTYGACHPDAGGPCYADTDCAAGANGRCECEPVGATTNAVDVCTYDECASESGCGKGRTCNCRDDVIQAGAYDSQICLAAACRVDGDCGDGGYCSPSRSPARACNPTSWAGFYCHGPQDKCVDDTDCAGQHESCAFEGDAGHWACSAIYCPPDS